MLSKTKPFRNYAEWFCFGGLPRANDERSEERVEWTMLESSQTVKTHQDLTFGKLTDFFVGRHGVPPKHFPPTNPLCSAR
ncbi:MAG: hypothetical protein HYV65_02095 [Candidatus Spechtbacteria bacterium]|nr:hypothetical protein [Candidatus Spechtbacteria bacterium]